MRGKQRPWEKKACVTTWGLGTVSPACRVWSGGPCVFCLREEPAVARLECQQRPLEERE